MSIRMPGRRVSDGPPSVRAPNPSRSDRVQRQSRVISACVTATGATGGGPSECDCIEVGQTTHNALVRLWLSIDQLV
jgi:hypothetical protein